jgi:hypothetical protein
MEPPLIVKAFEPAPPPALTITGPVKVGLLIGAYVLAATVVVNKPAAAGVRQAGKPPTTPKMFPVAPIGREAGVLAAEA